ncbi:hypothetical protein DENIS_1630 [Desulfonema ishimotonii]|uniref:Uncharacterized protein n=1 Tax=Desulfonema ishimotonii TaxID=45657 RepID=A0A401FUP0_9BACT|nr:hypothetical protein DENIS_1630 [Desulfonema ishimotonii]
MRPYPFFTRQMAQAFTLTGTDVVYAGVNYQREDGLNSAPHCPFSHLFLKNIIPAGSFAVSFDALQKHRIFFDIRMGRAGEWHFLLRLVEKGFRFEALRESLAEIRESPETGNRLSPHEEAAIRSYIRSTRFSIDGHVMAEMAASVPGPTPRSCGIRNRGGEQGRWKWRVLKKIWSVLPLRLRALIKKGYMRFTVAVDAFWES